MEGLLRLHVWKQVRWKSDRPTVCSVARCSFLERATVEFWKILTLALRTFLRTQIVVSSHDLLSFVVLPILSPRF